MTQRPLRVGVLNLMPKAESYEAYLVQPLVRSRANVEPVLLRLESHRSKSSDREQLARYVTYDQARRQGPLDGLLISGAPVEELPFEEVAYWPELSALLERARAELKSTLGLCWGGLALAALLGLEKQAFSSKLFGVFRNRSLVSDGPFLAGGDDLFSCAHSRHSGIADDALLRAQHAGKVRLLSYGRETGYSIFESPDHRYLIHLGHPEYETARLSEEWARDRGVRPDVRAPVDYDLEAPLNTWRSHRTNLFDTWLSFIASGAAS